MFKNISLENLMVDVGPVETEVTAANDTLSTIPEDVEISVSENTSEIIKMTEAGEILLRNIDTLQTFADESERVLEVGVVTPDVLQNHIGGVNDVLAAVGDAPLSVVSTESTGSARVSLESAVANTKERIKQLREFVTKIVHAIIQKMKEFWRDYVGSAGRFKAKATLVAKEAAKLNRGDKPRSETIGYNAKYLNYSGNDAHHVYTGLNATVKSVEKLVAEVERTAKAHHDYIEAECKAAKRDNYTSPGHMPSWGFTTGILSGGYSIELDASGPLPVFRIKAPSNPLGNVEISAPGRDDISMVANETRELAHVLTTLNDAEKRLAVIHADQFKFFDDLCKHALDNPGTVANSTIRRIGDLANKHFGNDLIVAHRYYSMVGAHALSLAIKALRNY